jgi:hypothetical protein
MTLIHGIDSTDKIVPLLLDASGNVIVSASQLTTTGGKIKLDSSGRIIVDGDTPSLLRPEPKAYLYSNLNLAAGFQRFTTATVPAGQYWRVTQSVLTYVGAVAGAAIMTQFDVGSGIFSAHYSAALASGQPISVTLNILLKPGDIIYLGVTAGALNDDAYQFISAERVY